MARLLCVFTAAGSYIFWLSVGCGDALNPAGAACSIETECSAGLDCLPLAKSSGGQCLPQTMLCSKKCKTDRDCVAVTTDFKCIATCSGSGVCGKAE